MTSMELFSMNFDLIAAGKTLLMTRSDFTRLWLDHWNSIEPCTDEAGYQILDLLIKEIERFAFSFGRGAKVGIEQGIDELYCQALIRRHERYPGFYQRHLLDSFGRWYKQLKYSLDKALDDVDTQRGNNSHSDFIDSLPLAGPAIVKTILKKEFHEIRHLERSIRMATSEGWKALICEGENYVESTYARVAAQRFLAELFACHLTPAEQERASLHAFLDD